MSDASAGRDRIDRNLRNIGDRLRRLDRRLHGDPPPSLAEQAALRGKVNPILDELAGIKAEIGGRTIR